MKTAPKLRPVTLMAMLLATPVLCVAGYSFGRLIGTLF